MYLAFDSLPAISQFCNLSMLGFLRCETPTARFRDRPVDPWNTVPADSQTDLRRVPDPRSSFPPEVSFVIVPAYTRVITRKKIGTACDYHVLIG